MMSFGFRNQYAYPEKDVPGCPQICGQLVLRAPSFTITISRTPGTTWYSTHIFLSPCQHPSHLFFRPRPPIAPTTKNLLLIEALTLCKTSLVQSHSCDFGVRLCIDPGSGSSVFISKRSKSSLHGRELFVSSVSRKLASEKGD